WLTTASGSETSSRPPSSRGAGRPSALTRRPCSGGCGLRDWHKCTPLAIEKGLLSVVRILAPGGLSQIGRKRGLLGTKRQLDLLAGHSAGVSADGPTDGLAAQVSILQVSAVEVCPL